MSGDKPTELPSEAELAEMSRDDLVRLGTKMDGVELVHFAEPVEDPVDDRPAADREELLGDGVRERPQSRRVPRRQDDRSQVPSSQEAR